VGRLCLRLSISLSGLHCAIQNLSEHAALTEQRLRTLEAAHPEAVPESPTPATLSGRRQW
jgi:hypothetical protein